MGIKYSVLLDRYNVVHATSPCHEVKDDEGKDGFLPSLILDKEAMFLGCKLVIVDEDDLPTEEDVVDCSFDFEEKDRTKKFKSNQVHKEWRVKSDIRVMRQQELLKSDYLSAAAFLNDAQKQEYETWKKQWLDAPETLDPPNSPSEWIDEIVTGSGRTDLKELKTKEREQLQNTIKKIKRIDL